VPETADAPPLFTWLADRLDELAGIPPGRDHALTLGDLWCGSVSERTPAQQALVRTAALDPEQRVISLVLNTTDLNGRRAHRLPFLPADQAERLGGSRFLFCEACLAGLVPERVIIQMVKASPSTDTDHPCPRHSEGVLRELPEPWDLPVVFAARLSCSPPGLLAAVPLCSVSEVPAAAAHDMWGQQVASAEDDTLAGRSVARLHWFTDGGLTSNAAVSTFDALLPRWPTFAFTLEDTAPELAQEIIRLPKQDAGAPHRAWRPIGGAAALFSALIDAGLSWRDSAQADMPGFRGRVALLRRTGTPAGGAWLLSQDAVLALAVRGLHAGTALRERFTGSDDQVPGQTQTDRYRWIRLRMALREYRNMSLGINARLPLYRDLASSYHVPAALSDWFDPPLPPAERDPAWADAASVVTTLRALSAGGVLDFDADRGAPPNAPDLRLLPPE
jgi:predicted acylesterase/phospholipase RssA